jgi:hypothetical protein
MKTIHDMEAQAEEKLLQSLRELNLVPAGYRCLVRLRGKSRDKKRTASFEKSWSPDTDVVCIRFEPAREQLSTDSLPTRDDTPGAAPNPTTKSDSTTSDPLSDLVRALDRVESRPGFAFVALKWFRDTALASENFSWAGADSARQAILSDAIEKRLILTSKVPNPKSPQFPVTAIRLNRLTPQVNAILGVRSPDVPDFQPVQIRGEGLSETVLRDRR